MESRASKIMSLLQKGEKKNAVEEKEHRGRKTKMKFREKIEAAAPLVFLSTVEDSQVSYDDHSMDHKKLNHIDCQEGNTIEREKKDSGLPDVLPSPDNDSSTEEAVRKNEELFLCNGRQEVSFPIQGVLNELDIDSDYVQEEVVWMDQGVEETLSFPDPNKTAEERDDFEVRVQQQQLVTHEENIMEFIFSSQDNVGSPNTLLLQEADRFCVDVGELDDSVPKERLVPHAISPPPAISANLEEHPRNGEPKKKSVPKMELTKKRRETGRAYQGRKKNRDNGKWDYSVPRPPKELKGPCNCKLSQTGKTIMCGTIDDVQRQTIFRTFWKKMTWAQKSTHIRTLVDTKCSNDLKNRKDSSKSRRTYSMKFFLQVQGRKVRVCKKMFLNTLAVTDWYVHNSLKSSHCHPIEPIEEEEEVALTRPSKRHRRSAQEEEKINHLRNFLNDLHKMESHYCRKNTKKLFLDSQYQKKTAVYESYTNHCLTENIQPASLTTFYKIFEEMNLSIFKPRKDQCDVCVSYREGNLDAEKYQRHQQYKDAARKEKEADECNPDNLVFTMDTQGVLLCPRLKASAQYYKMKLSVHNFTIFNKRTKDVACYVWHEGEAGVTSNEFVSIIIDFLRKQNITDGQQIVLWSDGCGYQNRNSNLSSALISLSQELKVTISQKYLEKGHTQMECDSIHAAIERKLKGRQIYVPAGYVDVISSARMTPQPYDVHYVNHTFFKEYSKMPTLPSIRPGSSKGDPTVTDIRGVKYCPNGEIMYKLDFNHDWMPLPRKRKSKQPIQISLGEVPPLFTAPPKIKPDKYKHLQQLKEVIASDYHLFYDQLRH